MIVKKLRSKKEGWGFTDFYDAMTFAEVELWRVCTQGINLTHIYLWDTPVSLVSTETCEYNKID